MSKNKPPTTIAKPLPKHRPTGHTKQITAQQEPEWVWNRVAPRCSSVAVAAVVTVLLLTFTYLLTHTQHLGTGGR